MSDAVLEVLCGPDQGRTFALDEELVHVGGGPENQVALNDETIASRQASIVRRNGRFAICTPIRGGVAVDGNPLPAERWVWLPAVARIRLSNETEIQFIQDVTGEPGPSPNLERRSSRLRRSDRSRKTSAPGRERQVARFITDQAGEHLVTLGEDGNLPELSLAETTVKPAAEKRADRSNPLLTFAIVIGSVGLSMIMLFIDIQPGRPAAVQVSEVRREIVEFYGDPDGELKPYERLLREARLAHARGDRAAEQNAYRQILRLVNSEDNNRFTGLTGSPERDQRLRELVAILLGAT